MALSQGRKVGRSSHVTVLPKDPELWPLLCGEQNYQGVTISLWFPRMVAAPGQPLQLLPALFLCSGGGSLQSCWAECRPLGIQQSWYTSWTSASGSAVRFENFNSVTTFICPYHICLFCGNSTNAYESFMFCESASQSVGWAFGTSHSPFVYARQKVRYPRFPYLVLQG